MRHTICSSSTNRWPCLFRDAQRSIGCMTIDALMATAQISKHRKRTQHANKHMNQWCIQTNAINSLLLRQSADACTVENTEQRSKPTTGESGPVELAAYANRQYREASISFLYTNTSILMASGLLHLLIDKPNKAPSSSRSFAATYKQSHIVGCLGDWRSAYM